MLTAVPLLTMTLLAGGYVAVTTGRINGSTVFLALAGGTLSESVRHIFNAMRALFTDMPLSETTLASGRRRKELEREKAAVLKALKELELDHEMRKVSDSDFAEIGGVYRARAIRVMRQLDEGGLDYQRLVEEELAKRRRAPVKKTAPVVAAAKISEISESKSPSCPSCDASNDDDALFCKKCAHRLVDPATGVA